MDFRIPATQTDAELMIVLARCQNLEAMDAGLPSSTPNLKSATHRPPLKQWWVLTSVLVMAGSMSFYLNDLGPKAKSFQGVKDEFHDTHGDLFAPWYGSRELLLRHRDPYKQEITREIQDDYYGKELTGAPDEPKDQQRFAYPVYVVFLLAPFVHLSFATVRIIFWWVLPAITLATIPAWMRLVGVRNSLFPAVSIAAMSLTSVPIFRGLHLQQLGLLVAGLIAACAVCMVRTRYTLGGVFLALATVKPQMAVLPAAWLTAWVFFDWHGRKSFLWGFFPTLTALLVASWAILPGWFPEFAMGLLAYRRYAGGGSLAEFYLAGASSLLLSGLAVAMIATVCWLTRSQPGGSLGFAFAFSTVLALSVLVVPALSAVSNQILFFPALLLPLRMWRSVWTQGLRARLAFILFILALLLPWLCAVAVLLVWAVFGLPGLSRIWGLPLYAWLPAPFAITGLVVFMLKDVLREPESAQLA
jgi:hypothetical protein